MKTYMGCISSRLSSFKLSLRSIILAVLFSAVFYELSFSSQVFALYTPTLSASVDNTAASVNGNQVINSTNKTTEIPLNLTVNTNNKTGYTATLNSETDETALVNNDSTNGARINSISSAGLLGNFSNNTWGYKFGTSANYAPIPALSTPAQILQTTGKTNGNESNQLSIGMKLSDNLENGRYTNKLIFSILTNNYEDIAIMTEGPDFNTKLKALETATSKIERFKKSTVAPVASMSAVNIEDEDSDYEIKLWLDPTDKTAYYYAEPEKVYLNTDSSKMFYSEYGEQKIKNILELDVSNFDTSKVTNMQYMFIFMSNLTTLDVSNFNTSKVTSMEGMFLGMSNLATLDLSNFNTSKVTNMRDMLSSMSSLTSLNLSSFNTSKVMNMNNMFSGMSNLTALNLSNFDTRNVIYMNAMFMEAWGIEELNLSSFDTSNVWFMGNMFKNTHKLKNLDVHHFNTQKVKHMQYMFYGSGATSLDLSHFDTSKVEDMSKMFAEMANITELDLSNFNTSNVKDMSRMFDRTAELRTLDLSNFNTSKVTDFSKMFASEVTNKLERIYVKQDFDTSAGTDFTDIFTGRTNLRGGNGSFLPDPSTADKTWLRIDDPANGHPGYFTRKV